MMGERCRISTSLKHILEEHGRIDGMVDSVFEQVLNLETEYGMVSCLKKKNIMVPYGVEMSSDFQPMKYSVGSLFSLFLLPEYTEVDLFLSSNAKIRDVDGLRLKAGHYLKENEKPLGIGEIISRTLYGVGGSIPSTQSESFFAFVVPVLEEWISVLRTGNNLVREKNILGLGVGLTPSSDDFVLGILSVFHYFGDRREAILKTYIRQYLPTTTKISRNMLSNALSDEYPSFILDFYRAAEQGEADIENALNQFRLHGHSSGMDTLYGIYIGLGCLI